ncbi:MAG: hypothetical protein IJW25_00715 [Clostridia bacterium]|nr:hypothetical protein [Clostridia bacterium]
MIELAMLSGFWDPIIDIFNDMLSAVSSIVITPIAALLYTLQIGFFVLMDFVQLLFRKIAGLDSYFYMGEEQKGDMVMDFIMDPTVLGVFFSVLVVAIILLFVTTFVAIVKSEITEKGANPKGPIIGRALKSILYFAMVPVVSILGIYMANVFLKTLDQATMVNKATTLSGMVFSAASHDANRARNNSELAKTFAADFQNTSASMNQEEIAQIIDEAFAQAQLRVNSNGSYPSNPYDQEYMFAANILLQTEIMELYPRFDYCCFPQVFYYYDLLFGYDYLIGFIGGFIACSLLLSTCLGCMQRIFELTILFVISPPLIAMMPVDGGSKYNSWRGEFIKRVMALYGPIIGLNLAFMILTMLGNVTLFPDTPAYAVFNRLVKMFFMIVCLISVKEFSGMISGLIGSNDALSQGESKKEATTKMAGKIGTAGVQMAKRGVGALANSDKMGYDKDGNKEKGAQAWMARRVGSALKPGKGVGEALSKAGGFGQELLGSGLDVLNKSTAGAILKTAGLDKYTDVNKMNEAKGFGQALLSSGVKWDTENMEFKDKKTGYADRAKEASEAKAAKDAAEADYAKEQNLIKMRLKEYTEEGSAATAQQRAELANHEEIMKNQVPLSDARARSEAIYNDKVDKEDKDLYVSNLNAEIAQLDADIKSGKFDAEELPVKQAKLENLQAQQEHLKLDATNGGIQDNILDIEMLMRSIKDGTIKVEQVNNGSETILQSLNERLGELNATMKESKGEIIGVANKLDTIIKTRKDDGK